MQKKRRKHFLDSGFLLNFIVNFKRCNKDMNNIDSCKIILINNVNNHLISKKLYKQYAFLAYLKKASKEDIIIDFTKRTDEIADITQCSKSTLYRKIKELKKLGWVTKSKKDLIIKSWDEVTQLLLGTYAVDKDGEIIKIQKVVYAKSRKLAEDSILFKNFETSYGYQQEAIDKQIESYNDKVNNHLESFKNLFPKDSRTGKLSKLQRFIPYHPSNEIRFKHQEIIRLKEARKNNKPVENLIQLDKSFSRYSISKILGFKSKSSGHRFIQRAKAYGWIKERVRHGVISKISEENFWEIKKKYNKPGLFFKKGCLIKKMSSVFEIVSKEKETYPIQKNVQGDEYEQSYQNKVRQWYDNIIARQQFIYKTKFKTVEDLIFDIDPLPF